MITGDLIPIVVMITTNRTKSEYDFQVFSSEDKAAAHFLCLCVEHNVPYKSQSKNNSEKINRIAHKNGKTISLEWVTIK